MLTSKSTGFPLEYRKKKKKKKKKEERREKKRGGGGGGRTGEKNQPNHDQELNQRP